MNIKPTRRAAILSYIKQYQTDAGYPPTIIEIGKALGLAKTTVHYHLGKMIDEGIIERRPNSARGMKVL